MKSSKRPNVVFGTSQILTIGTTTYNCKSDKDCDKLMGLVRGMIQDYIMQQHKHGLEQLRAGVERTARAMLKPSQKVSATEALLALPQLEAALTERFLSELVASEQIKLEILN